MCWPFQKEAGDAGAGEAAADFQAAALQALDAAIFHATHVQGMAEVVSAAAQKWAATGFAAEQELLDPERLIARNCQWQLLLVRLHLQEVVCNQSKHFISDTHGVFAEGHR